MTAVKLRFQHEHILLDPSGALIWPRMSLMAVADLHLEKGSACARRGHLVPPWDSQTTLARVGCVAAQYRPQIILAAGDSFHDRDAAARLAPEDRAGLAALANTARLIWVSGNHDPEPPYNLPGQCVAEFTAGPFTFRHQSQAGAQGEIFGHFHPKARIATRAGEITRPCFLADPARIMLPSFGAYTGGLDIRNPAIAALYPGGAEAFLLGRTQLFRFAVPPPPAEQAAAHPKPQ
jgi:DNA ligase-associated metallophosphoesterase